MTKASVKLALLLGALFSLGCSYHVVQVRLQKPGVSDLREYGVESLAVMDFAGPGMSGRVVANRLDSALVDAGFFKVSSRKRIGEVLARQEVGDSQCVDGDAAVKIGELLGVDAVLTGSVDLLNVEDKRGRKSFTKPVSEGGDVRDGRKTHTSTEYEEYVMRQGAATVTFKLTGVKKGTRIDVWRENAVYASKKDYDGGDNLPDKGPILINLVSEVVDNAVARISPHYETEDRVLIDEPETHEGFEHAVNGTWEEAFEIWAKSIKAHPDCAALHYDIGLAHERAGRLGQAEVSYMNALQFDPMDLYMDSLKNVRDLRGK
ncbi:CsgG/HfaB family protein [Candidatus Hydrogenedentota bacterium]